jgi:2-methylisocitrate lyase-like PEP mutase family enzyme
MKTIDDFAALHRADDPLVLFNVWDAGSAAAVAEAGAKAIATGSLSLAGAQGYDDGESMPFAAVLESVRRIAATIDLPLTVDFETGYAEDERELARNAAALLDAGAIGCNLEDRLLDSAALRDASRRFRRRDCSSTRVPTYSWGRCSQVQTLIATSWSRRRSTVQPSIAKRVRDVSSCPVCAIPI